MIFGNSEPLNWLEATCCGGDGCMVGGGCEFQDSREKHKFDVDNCNIAFLLLIVSSLFAIYNLLRIVLCIV